MSDAAPAEQPAEGGAKPSKKKLIIIVVAILVLVGGVVGGLFAAGILKMPGGHAKTEAAEEGKEEAGSEHGEEAKSEGGEEGGHGGKEGDKSSLGDSSFYEMPNMIVNLTGDNGKQRFLKISITLELNKKGDSKTIEGVLPRVTDHFQTYLRELRLDDLRGSAGLYRLRQELLDRVKSASGVDVKDVLFEEILVQ